MSDLLTINSTKPNELLKNCLRVIYFCKNANQRVQSNGEAINAICGIYVRFIINQNYQI